MSDNSLYQFYFDCALETKAQTYNFLSEIACQSPPKYKNVIITQFEQREKVGTFLIEEHILLPHVESEYVSKSQILIIRLKNSIDWDDNIKDIRLIIAILLKKDEEQATKKKISVFTKSLVEEEFLDRLLNIEKKLDFEETIIKFLEGSL